MPALTNPRHEAFAQARAGGLDQYDAYRNAGFTGSKQSASQIANLPEVQDRVQELFSEKADAIRKETMESDDGDIRDLDRAWILKTLKQNITRAQASGQISAANKAVEMMMDMLGLTPRKKGNGGAAAHESDDDGTQNASSGGGSSDDHLTKVLDRLDQIKTAGEDTRTGATDDPLEGLDL